MASSETLQLVDLWLVHAMLLGQTVFVIVWVTLPWWREWVGRALMVKSFALWTLLVAAIGNYWVIELWGPYRWTEWVALGSHVLILVGIWSQVVAIGYEMRRTDRPEDHNVLETEERV